MRLFIVFFEGLLLIGSKLVIITRLSSVVYQEKQAFKLRNTGKQYEGIEDIEQDRLKGSEQNFIDHFLYFLKNNRNSAPITIEITLEVL